MVEWAVDGELFFAAVAAATFPFFIFSVIFACLNLHIEISLKSWDGAKAIPSGPGTAGRSEEKVLINYRVI